MERKKETIRKCKTENITYDKNITKYITINELIIISNDKRLQRISANFVNGKSNIVFKIYFIFLVQFQFYRKTEQNMKRVPLRSLPLQHAQPLASPPGSYFCYNC